MGHKERPVKEGIPMGLLAISLVIENSRSAVSGEQPKLETNSFSSVLSGFVI